MTIINTHCSVIALNIKDLKTPIIRHRLTEQTKKQNPSFCCLQELIFKDKHPRKDGKNHLQANTSKHFYPVSGKIDFELKLIRRNK